MRQNRPAISGQNSLALTLQLFLTRSKRKERTDFLGLCAFCALCAAKERPGEIPALNYWFKYSALAKEPDAVFPPP